MGNGYVPAGEQVEARRPEMVRPRGETGRVDTAEAVLGASAVDMAIAGTIPP